MKKAYRLTPSLHECIWGGTRLGGFGKDASSGKLGESWELSFVPGSEALVDGVKISEKFDRGAWGEACQGFESFPVLTKFIDANDSLSVQVHPSDAYALENEGQYGKTEMWYVVGAEEGAGIYMGLKRSVSAEEFAAAVSANTVEELLSFRRVKAGDVYFIPSGTVHAIGKGVLIFEIQQNSTLTYRLYDYGRVDACGNPRELHVQKAMKVATLERYEPTVPDTEDPTVIGRCDYFTTRLYKLSDEVLTLLPSGSFISVTCTAGEGVIDGERISRGDSFFIPDGVGRVEISGNLELCAISVERNSGK